MEVETMSSLRRLSALILLASLVGCISSNSESTVGAAYFFGLSRAPLDGHSATDGAGNITGTDIAFGLNVGHQNSGVALTLYPLHGFMFQSKPVNGFQWETFETGQRACRELSNGQFASNSKCAGSVDYMYTPSAEITQKIGTRARIGVGYRGGDLPEAFVVLLLGPDRSYFGIRWAENYLSLSIGVLY